MTLEKVLDLAGLAQHGLGLISKLTHNSTDDRAVEVLAGIRGVLAVLHAGADGSVTPESCRSALAALNDKLRDNDAAADAALRAKFDVSER